MYSFKSTCVGKGDGSVDHEDHELEFESLEPM